MLNASNNTKPIKTRAGVWSYRGGHIYANRDGTYSPHAGGQVVPCAHPRTLAAAAAAIDNHLAGVANA